MSSRCATAIGKRRSRIGATVEAVDRDQVALEPAEIEMEVAHRGAVDDAQEHPPTRFDLDGLGIGQGAEIGEEGVVLDVVEVGRRRGASLRHRHARHRVRLRHRGWRGAGRRRHSSHRPCLFEAGENLLRRGEAEIGQHDHDFLLVRAVALIVNDERRGHQELLLQALVRMHPERPAESQREIVVGAAARRNRRAGNSRHAVLPPRRRQPMPMDEARLVDAVLDPHAEGLADLGRQAERPVGLTDAEHRGGPAVHLDVAALQSEDGRGRRGPSRRGRGDVARVAAPPARIARLDSMGSLLDVSEWTVADDDTVCA